MHKLLLAGVSAIALGVTGAQAQDFVYPKGEGAFSWPALEEFVASHKGLEGQTVTVWGPWREGGDQDACGPLTSSSIFSKPAQMLLRNCSNQARAFAFLSSMSAGRPAGISGRSICKLHRRFRVGTNDSSF